MKAGLPKRNLLITKEFWPWCNPAGKHPDPRVTDTILAESHAQFNAFVRGEVMERDIDLKLLDPDAAEVWSLKTYMKKPYLRFLGWFPLAKTFVIANAKVRDDLEKEFGPKWDAAIQYVIDKREVLIPGKLPFAGVVLSDYID